MLPQFESFVEQQLRLQAEGIARRDAERAHVFSVEEFDTLRLDELRAWQKFATHRLGKANTRPFEAIWLAGDIADNIHLELAQNATKTGVDALFTRVADNLAIKAIQATRLNFELAFEDVLAEARSGNLTRRRFATIMRSLIAKHGNKAYRDGLTDGGTDPDEIDEEQVNEIASIKQEQSQYVTSFGETLFKGDGVSDAQAIGKAEMWFNKSIMPFYQKALLSADKNGMFEWVYGQTEHCADCLRLSGQRHTMKNWNKSGYLPQSNGSEELECGGFNCKCKFVRVYGRARGKY